MCLAFNQDIGPAITKAINDNSDDEGMQNGKAAAIVRRNMLIQVSYKFEGNLNKVVRNLLFQTRL